MATITGLRTALATNLDTITGLRTHATAPGQIASPAAVIHLEQVDYDSAMGRGLDEYTFSVRVYVSAANDRKSQDNLDAYLASSGAGSVKAAIESDRTLGGAACDVRVTAASGYALYQYAGSDYLAAEWSVTVYATGA